MEDRHWNVIAKYFSGEAGISEKEYVERWKSESEANKQVFESFQKMVQGTDTNCGFIPNTEGALKAVNAVIRKKGKNNITRFFSGYGAIAAFAIVLLAIGVLLKMGNSEIFNNSELIVIRNPGTVFFSDTLPDGSVVYINKNSEIVYSKNFAGPFRELNLSGEAFFEVTKDKDRPFIVNAGGARIKVLGTSFNVNAYPNAKVIDVTVVEGRVEVADKMAADSKKIVLEKGFKGTFDKKSCHLNKGHIINKTCLDWRKGFIEFNDTRLDCVIDKLSQLYFVDIEIDSKELEEQRLTASFQDQGILSIMEVLKVTFGAELIVENKKFVLKSSK